MRTHVSRRPTLSPRDHFVEPLESRELLDTALGSAAFIFSTTASTAATYVDGAGGPITPQTAQSTSLISLDDFRADPRFSGINGAGFSTVIMDTGIDRDHPFFGPDANNNGIADRIVYSYDFANGDNNASDVNGHGSNVSSIVASSDSTHRGMAPGANIIHLKVFTDAGGGNFSYIEAALQWCVANANTYNIASINMSLGDNSNRNTAASLYGCSDEIAALAAMDVIVVSAAGNSFSSFSSAQGVAYPAADPNSLGVGAVYDANVGGFSYASGASASSTGPDRITPFSQRHSTLTEIFAPGAPITGASQSGGTVAQHGTSQASPHIAGIAVLAQQLAVQALGRRLTLAEFTSLLRTTGDSIVDGDDEADNVTNTGLTFKRVNVFNLGAAILAMSPDQPEITVTESGSNVADGATGINFGSRFITSPAAKTFTITNTGNLNLTLGDTVTIPAGYTVLTGFSDTDLDPGESTTLVLQYDALTAGVRAGTVSFTTNDASEGTFNFTVTGTGITTAIVDDGAASGWSQTGAWSSVASGYAGDSRWVARGTGLKAAQWTFTGLPDGYYRVSANFVAKTDRASNATYTIADDQATVKTRILSQRTAPNDRSASGVWWEDLGMVNIESGTAVIRLTDNGNGTFAADAVRIERLSAPNYFAEVSLKGGTTAVTDGGAFAFGSTIEGTDKDIVFTVTNTGTIALELDDLAVPTGYSIVSGFGSTSLATDQTTTFTVRLESDVLGAKTGAVSFTTNDADENPFNFNVTGSVGGFVTVIDDGMVGFATTGSWATGAAGYSADSRSRAGAGVGGGSNTATWSFTGLAAGNYRVSVSYPANTNRATNSPFTVYDGTASGTSLGTFLKNQRNAANDRKVGAIWFEDLGTFTITGDTLTVRLTDAANGYVIADAVRLEHVA